MALSTSYTEVATSPNYSAVRVGLKYAYISGKTVRVYIGLYVNSSYSGGYGSDYCTAKVNGATVRGNGSYSAGSYRVYGVGWTDIGYTDVTISSGGSGGSVATNVSWSIWSFHFQSTPSGTVTIPAGAVPSSQYDAASTISLSSSSVAIGSSVTLTASNSVYSGYSHNFYIYVGGTNRKTLTKSGTGSVTFTPDYDTFAKLNTSGTSISATVYLNTYRGSTYIGQTSKALTITIPNNATTKPTVSHTITPLNVYRDIYNLQSIAQFRVQSTATAKYSASISSYAVTFNGASVGSGADVTTSAINASGSKNIVTTAKDSRGITNTATTAVNITPYSRPSLGNVVSQRCDSTGTPQQEGTWLLPTFNITHTTLNVDGSDANICNVTLRWKKKSETEWSNPINVISGTAVDINLDTNSTYDIQYILQDNVGTVFDLPTYTYTDLVSTAFTLLDFAKYGKSMAVGKVSEAESLTNPHTELQESSCFENGLPSYFYDGLYAKYKEDADFVDILDKLSILYNLETYTNGTCTYYKIGKLVIVISSGNVTDIPASTWKTISTIPSACSPIRTIDTLFLNNQRGQPIQMKASPNASVQIWSYPSQSEISAGGTADIRGMAVWFTNN